MFWTESRTELLSSHLDCCVALPLTGITTSGTSAFHHTASLSWLNTLPGPQRLDWGLLPNVLTHFSFPALLELLLFQKALKFTSVKPPQSVEGLPSSHQSNPLPIHSFICYTAGTTVCNWPWMHLCMYGLSLPPWGSSCCHHLHWHPALTVVPGHSRFLNVHVQGMDWMDAKTSGVGSISQEGSVFWREIMTPLNTVPHL